MSVLEPLDHGAHALVEQSVLSGRERFRREHNDWELTILGILPEMLNDRKAVQAWHEQISRTMSGLVEIASRAS